MPNALTANPRHDRGTHNVTVASQRRASACGHERTPRFAVKSRIVLALAYLEPGSLLEALPPIPEANAVVGRPATPVSVAGVARRTTRRVIRRTTIYVVSLPPSCTVVVVEGTQLHLCGGTYYQQVGTQYVVVVVE